MSVQTGPKGLYTLPTRLYDPLGRLYPGCALLVILSVASLWIGTQFVAKSLGFQRQLGRPMVAHVYEPFEGAVWALRYDKPQFGPQSRQVFARARALVGVELALSVLLTI